MKSYYPGITETQNNDFFCESKRTYLIKNTHRVVVDVRSSGLKFGSKGGSTFT